MAAVKPFNVCPHVTYGGTRSPTTQASRWGNIISAHCPCGGERQRPTPTIKPPISRAAPAMVAQSLSSLLQRASIDDHEEAIQSCDAVLAKSKNDSTAQYIKIIALLKLDRYEDALRVLEAGGDAIKKQASFEYAYVLYKLGKLEEALQAVSQMTSSRGASHLEAQVVRSSI